MKKNFLWITTSGVSDMTYFIDLRDKKKMVEDLTDFAVKFVIFKQKIDKIDFVEEKLGAW